jgi:hypothetical protein
MIKVLATAACGLLLTGCVSLSRSTPVNAIGADDAGQLRITEITLSVDPLVKVSPQFEAIFKEHVKAKLDACARGERPARLDATIERLDKSNALMVAIVAGANVVRGSAKLTDMESGRAVADYKIGQTVVGRSVAVIVMATAEEQLSDGFGDELCKQAFPAAPRK